MSLNLITLIQSGDTLDTLFEHLLPQDEIITTIKNKKCRDLYNLMLSCRDVKQIIVPVFIKNIQMPLSHVLCMSNRSKNNVKKLAININIKLSKNILPPHLKELVFTRTFTKQISANFFPNP